MKGQLQFYRCFVHAGHVVFSDKPSLALSVCGNGVVVTIWDRARRFGGMAHCIFPKSGPRQRRTNYHADVAIPLLVRQFISSSSRINHLEAQVFGGGSLRGVSEKRAARTLKAVRHILRRMRISVVSEDVGGAVGRKIIFNTFSGDTVVYKTKKVRLTDWAPEYLTG
ncbi:MAG TPA: hypothetical protein DCL35_07100 [Candidatus Omnitrophica bacterium]|nr:hypothetical protein [Candidatus Omnitrophota bacterium]